MAWSIITCSKLNFVTLVSLKVPSGGWDSLGHRLSRRGDLTLY